MTTVLITGDRHWDHPFVILKALRAHSVEGDKFIHGMARGADIQGAQCAHYLMMDVVGVPAQWNKYGRAAGPLRNIEMLDMGPDLVLAFHNNLTASKGTKHCVREALKRGIPVYLYSYDGYVGRPNLTDVT